MGTHKEKTGKTRVGKFLQGVKGVAPEILNLAGNITGMDMLKNLGDAIEGSPSISEDDKAVARELLQLDIQEMQEITKRWQSDMTSDSWLSKNVRPLALMFLTVFVCVMAFSDSKTNWAFEMDVAYIELFKALLLAVYLAYFGSRGYEKAQKIKK